MVENVSGETLKVSKKRHMMESGRHVAKGVAFTGFASSRVGEELLLAYLQK